MNKFQEILNHHKLNIHNHIGYDMINFTMLGNTPRITCIKGTMRSGISLNDLLSPESGFLQACKWKKKPGIYASDWKNHTAYMLFMTSEQKIKYLEDNIIIE